MNEQKIRKVITVLWNFTKKTQIGGIMNDTLITIFSGCFLIILNLPR